MVTEEQLAFYGILALAAFLVGLSKGGLGGMMGALITPLVAMVIPLDQAIGLMLPILILGDGFAIAAHWRKWNSRIVRLLVPGAILGVTIGTLILTNISVLQMRRIMGVIIILFIIYRVLENRLGHLSHIQPRRWHGYAAGGLAGITSTLAHAGGPPIAMYLLTLELRPTVFVAISALFFTVLNLIKVPYYFCAGLIDLNRIATLIWIVPFVPLGVWTGKRFANQTSKRVFDGVVLFLLTTSATILLLS